MWMPAAWPATFLSIVVQLDELFAHLLFWCVVIAALDVLDVPSYRVIGFACAVYAGVSIAWVVLMSRVTVVDTRWSFLPLMPWWCSPCA